MTLSPDTDPDGRQDVPDPRLEREALALEAVELVRGWVRESAGHRPDASAAQLAAALRDVVAEVEDSRSGPGGEPVAVDTVVVGDRVPDEATAALLQATREALVNAVVHGRPPVSLYLEVGAAEVEVFVKDRGDGFDPEAVSPDRFGVRESILGRVRRRGGTATVTSRPGLGTEVHLAMPFAPSAPADPSNVTPTGPGTGVPLSAGAQAPTEEES